MPNMILIMNIPKAKNITKIRKKKKFLICAIYGLIIQVIAGANFFVKGCSFDKRTRRSGNLASLRRIGRTSWCNVIECGTGEVLVIGGVLDLS